MSRKPKVSWILPLLLWSSLQSLVLASDSNTGQEPQRETSHPLEQQTRVTVLVYNYAHLPMQTLREAEGRASLIFRRAGVEIEWAGCPLNEEDPSLYPKCPAILVRLSFLSAFSQKRRLRWMLAAKLSWPLALPISSGIGSRNKHKDCMLPLPGSWHTPLPTS